MSNEGTKVPDGFLGPEDFARGRANTEKESRDCDSEDPWSIPHTKIHSCMSHMHRQGRRYLAGIQSIDCMNSLDDYSFVHRLVRAAYPWNLLRRAALTGSPLAFSPSFIMPDVLINEC